MTDDRIADLLGWPKGRAHRDSSLMHRIRIVVSEAQAEQSAQIERMRAALTRAHAQVAMDRELFVRGAAAPGQPLDPDDQEIADEYIELLRVIDEAREDAGRCACCGDVMHPGFQCSEAAALRAPQPPVQQRKPCWCHKCNGDKPLTHMVLCPECGNKRCPRASDHTLACTNSNLPGQPGSVYGITGDEA